MGDVVQDVGAQTTDSLFNLLNLWSPLPVQFDHTVWR